MNENNAKQSNTKNGVVLESNMKPISFGNSKRRNFGNLYTNIYNMDNKHIYNTGAQRKEQSQQQATI